MIGKFVDVNITSVFANSLRGDVLRTEAEMGLRNSIAPQAILAKQSPVANELGVNQFVPI